MSGGTLAIPNAVTLTLNGASNQVTGGTLQIQSGGTVAAGGNPFSVGASGTPDTSGSLTAGDFTSTGTITNTALNTISSSGNVAISNAFGATQTNGTLVMTGATGSLNAAIQIGNLQVNSSATGASLVTSALSLAGTLTLQSSAVLSAGALGITVAGATTITGIFNGGSGTDSFAAVGGGGTFNASSGSTTISGNLSVTGFTANSGSVSFTGGSHGAYSFYDLSIAGTVSATGAWTIGHDLTISSGAWTAGAFSHSVGGNWTNSVGTGGFVGAGSTISFTGAVVHAISGATNFNNLSDTVALSTLTFTAGQTFGVGGLLTLTGSAGNLITVKSSLGGSTWSLSNTGTNSVSYVSVSDSPATAAVTAASSLDLTGNNTNWSFIGGPVKIVASWTLDTDNNGRIDRIRVQVESGTTLNDTFSGFVAVVDGYTVNGYSANGPLAGTDVFDITLTEGMQENSSATPKWQVLSNTSLHDTIGGALVDYNTGTTVVKTYVPADGARPVITYTLAAIGSTKVYVRFSELVYGDAGASIPIGPLSLTYSGAGGITVQPMEMTGNGAHAAVVTLTNALTAADVFPAPQTISAVTNQIWGQPYPSQFVYPSSGSGSTTTSPGDPGSYTNTNLDTNLPPNASRSMLNSPTVPAHNISDVGLGFVTPVFALNRNLQRDSARGGVGMITNFDGTKWLLPQDVLLESRILEPTLIGADLSLFWDVTPPAAFNFNNLWIPTTASTLWAPFPAANSGGDRVHYPGNSHARTSGAGTPNGALRDSIIPGSDSEVKDGALLQLIFVLSDGTHFLPLAFAADPNNPSNVRPFEYTYHSIIEQRGHVTITNNVIRPANGEVAYVHYVMPKTGKISITVFSLGGDIVNVLASGTQNAGEYATGWDGKNRGGRIVARGIYFIRVVGPGFDEMRKVLVVR